MIPDSEKEMKVPVQLNQGFLLGKMKSVCRSEVQSKSYYVKLPPPLLVASTILLLDPSVLCIQVYYVRKTKTTEQLY